MARPPIARPPKCIHAARRAAFGNALNHKGAEGTEGECTDGIYAVHAQKRSAIASTCEKFYARDEEV
jgi:hypothetical protein